MLSKTLSWFWPLLLFPLFFYKLGENSLVSFDEAWFASVAREILARKDFINLYFNGQPFLDHPPAGYWLMAISLKIFGVNELGARFVQALAGLTSIYILYFLGNRLFSRSVGIASGLALASSPWFIFRARSGNLDSILVLFFLLTILLAFIARDNKIFLVPFSISLSLLLLTKTAIPFAAIPTLVLIFWGSKLSWRDFKIPAAIVIFVVGGWFLYGFFAHPGYLTRLAFVSFPGLTIKTSIFPNLLLFKTYLHSGIGKWFWPGMISIFLAPFLKEKRFLFLTIFFFTFSLPFVFSPKVHIWHLIPLHPVLILSFFGFSYFVLSRMFTSRALVGLIILVIALYFSFFQIQRNWHEFVDIPIYISDEEVLAREASRYPQDRLFIEGDFVHAAVFYSNKKVTSVKREEIKDFFNRQDKTLLITHNWLLGEGKIPQKSYKIIKEDKDKVLLITQ